MKRWQVVVVTLLVVFGLAWVLEVGGTRFSINDATYVGSTHYDPDAGGSGEVVGSVVLYEGNSTAANEYRITAFDGDHLQGEVTFYATDTAGTEEEIAVFGHTGVTPVATFSSNVAISSDVPEMQWDDTDVTGGAAKDASFRTTCGASPIDCELQYYVSRNGTIEQVADIGADSTNDKNFIKLYTKAAFGNSVTQSYSGTAGSGAISGLYPWEMDGSDEYRIGNAAGTQYLNIYPVGGNTSANDCPSGCVSGICLDEDGDGSTNCNGATSECFLFICEAGTWRAATT